MLIALALQLSVAVEAPDTATLNQPVLVRYRATAPGNTPPGIATPSVPGALATISDDRVRIGGGFGTAVATRELVVQLVPQRTGRLVLAAARATLGGEVALSPVRAIFVRQPPRNAVPAIVSRTVLDGREGVALRAITTPDTVWAGEQLTLQVGVFIEDGARLRLLKNPDYAPPDVPDAIAIELPVSAEGLPPLLAAGLRYRPYVFARALFALQPGRISIPPARLTVVESDRRGDAIERTLVTPARSVLVRELPLAGRPAAFRGAVGVYSLQVRADSSANASEDGAQVEVVVSGAGNVKLLPPPVLDVVGGTASVVRELVQLDTSDLLVRGSKTFRMAVTATGAARPVVRSVQYAWFNPARAAYETITVPLDSSVRAAMPVAAPDAQSLAAPAVPEVAVPTMRWLGLDPWRWPVAAALAALFLAGLAALLRAGGSPPAPVAPPVAADLSARAVRRRVVGALQPLFPAGTTVDASTLPQQLRRAGADAALASRAATLLRTLDALVYDTKGEAPPSLHEEVEEVLRAVQAGTVTRRTPRASAVVRRTVVLLALLPALLRAQAGIATPATTRLAALRAVAQAPSDAAAWAQLGQAQAAAGDSAGAQVAWRISSAIQPWRNPARASLSPPAAGATVRTRLPILPPVVLLGGIVVLAVAGIGAAWRGALRGAPRTVVALRAVAPWGLATPVALVVAHASLAPNLAMVREGTTLRLDPALAGEAVGRVRPGDIVIVEQRQPLWWQVRAAEGRPGWVPAPALRSLARRDRAAVVAQELEVAATVAAP